MKSVDVPEDLERGLFLCLAPIILSIEAIKAPNSGLCPYIAHITSSIDALDVYWSGLCP